MDVKLEVELEDELTFEQVDTALELFGMVIVSQSS